MQARIVGPEEELGEVYKPLQFFGNPLTREWSDITVNAEQHRKLQGNRYVELRGEGSAVQADPVADDDAAATVRARLDELGATYAPDASLKTLRTILTKAERAQAAALQEAEDAAAEAAEKAAAADLAGSQA